MYLWTKKSRYILKVIQIRTRFTLAEVCALRVCFVSKHKAVINSTIILYYMLYFMLFICLTIV